MLDVVLIGAGSRPCPFSERGVEGVGVDPAITSLDISMDPCIREGRSRELVFIASRIETSTATTAPSR